MKTLGIDVRTKDAKKLATRLRSLVSTQDVQGPFLYHEDESYAQLHVSTEKTEEELEHWLWATIHGCDYVGVFEVRA